MNSLNPGKEAELVTVIGELPPLGTPELVQADDAPIVGMYSTVELTVGDTLSFAASKLTLNWSGHGIQFVTTITVSLLVPYRPWADANDMSLVLGNNLLTNASCPLVHPTGWTIGCASFGPIIYQSFHSDLVLVKSCMNL